MKQKFFLKNRAYRFKRFARKAYSVFNSMHREVNIGVISISMLTFTQVTQTSAQTSLTLVPDSVSEQELEEVTVTGSRVDLTLNQAANLVTVISKKEIEQAPVQSIQDLLHYVSNIDVLQRGTHGVQADISLRGGSFDQTAILLNGMNISNPQTGHYSFDIPINLSDIERIEIIHGPSSLVYGANALSGGINIITKKMQESKASAYLEGGSYGLWGAEANGSLKTGKVSNQLSFSYNTSDGYIDDSDYDIYNALWQTGFRTKESKIDVQLGYNNKKYGANTFFSPAYPHQYEETSSYLAGIRGETGTKLKIIPRIYWSRHDDCFQLNRGQPKPVPYNYHHSDVYGANLNMQYRWSTGITSIGTDLRNEGILSSVLGKPMKEPNGHYTRSDNRTDINYFLEHNFLSEQFSLSLGMLANHNSALTNKGFDLYPVANISYQVSPLWKIYAAWKNATRMPTFTDLYYNTPTHSGNADLLPEKSTSLEFGFKFKNNFLNAFMTAYLMQGKNLIDWRKEYPDSKWQSQNLGTVNKAGIESGVDIYFQKLFPQLNRTTLKLGYTYLHQQSGESGEMISAYVLNYLKNKFTAQLLHPVYKDLTASWNFRWQDREGIYDQYENGKSVGNTPYNPYSILDLRVNWARKSFKFNINANNIFNVTYYDIGNIPQPGFWLSAGVGYTM